MALLALAWGLAHCASASGPGGADFGSDGSAAADAWHDATESSDTGGGDDDTSPGTDGTLPPDSAGGGDAPSPADASADTALAADGPVEAGTGPDGTSGDADATIDSSGSDVSSGEVGGDAVADTTGAGDVLDGGTDDDADGSIVVDSGGGEDAEAMGPEAGIDATCPADQQYSQTTFINLAPPMGAALDRNGGDPIPNDAGVPPAGWHFYQPGGAVCRDGSPAGFYVRYTSSTKLMIYLEGGGACDSQHFCDHNPANIDQIFPGGANGQGQTIGGSLILTTGLQQPYTTGIFDFTNSSNPFNGWNQVYVPYCTGDVFFGTVANAMVPGMAMPQQFVGYRNMQKFIGRIVPTFPGLDQVVLAGASAGGFGAGLNYGMVQDAFGSVPVSVIDDSGPPFSLTYLPACLQKEWRDLWGFDAALPSDCAECSASDGSGLTNIVYYWRHKYAQARVGLVSSMDDQVIELFFAQGINNCATNDPNLLVIGGLFSDGGTVYPNSMFESGLMDLRNTFACTGALATYYINGSNHQHIFRDEFFQPLSGGVTMATWATNLVHGTMTQIGP
ncbi:MAG TPA: pectin acetylesterase-family hydrolase [Polyangiaceae bacterium]|nr:pectin acetylesterase-family hydrolase [Polyangiaceae bacterium]